MHFLIRSPLLPARNLLASEGAEQGKITCKVSGAIGAMLGPRRKNSGWTDMVRQNFLEEWDLSLTEEVVEGIA